MNSERHQQIFEIFSQAQELPIEKRDDFLKNVCNGDDELRSEVESYLKSDDNIGDFIESSAIEVTAKNIADEQMASKIGQQIGHYKIISLLGAGGMGEVWLAEDVRLKRKVALKLLSAAHKKDQLARFEQEAHAISSLNHPNIITIFDIGQHNDWEFIATEFINGKTLRQLINEKTLDFAQSVKIAVQISTALAAAHSAGIIHRDIKPENIMIRLDGIAKVLDFGLARFSDEHISSLNEKLKTTPGMVMGTVAYMSPEQARGHFIDDKTDIFSLGIVLYEMFTGKQPFEGESGLDVLAAILKYEPQQLDESFPETIRNIISRSLKKDPTERPTATEILNEFESFTQSEIFSVEGGNQINFNRNDNQTIGLTAVTDKNARRKTANFFAARKLNPPKLFKPAVLIILLVMTLISSFIFYNSWSNNSSRVILTENDTLLLADFENKTGDKDFDDKVFDQSIFTSLRQSPYITTTNYNEVSDKLKELGKTPTSPITNDIAREISQRLGGKAYLKSSIESVNSKYLITFEAIEPETNKSLAKEQAEADNKESVIDALDKALTAMRGRLGEPVESVKQFSVPLRTAASSSITALKLFGLAAKAEYEDKHDDAIILYKRAIEADPEYTIAYYSLASIYSDNGQEKSAKEYLSKAFALRDRLTERDKPELTNFYYSYVTGEKNKEIEGYEIAKKKYPRDFSIPINLGNVYREIGDLTQAEQNFRLALKLLPKTITPRLNLAETLIKQSRFEEAKAVYLEAETLGAEKVETIPGFFTTAFALDNQSEIQRQLNLLKEIDENQALLLQANLEVFAGKSNNYKKLMSQAIEHITKSTPEIAGKYSGQVAINLATLGKCSEALDWAKRSLNSNQEESVLTNNALVSAICNEKPQEFIQQLQQKFPQHTIVNNVWLPIIQAAAEMKDSPEKALETLEANRQYETITNFWGNYLRGKIYLKLNKSELAAEEFQKILGNRGWAVESPIYPLAHHFLAQAFEKQNDQTNANIHRTQFAALWKNADSNLPVTKENFK